MMEIEYSEQEFVNAFHAVMQAENTDAFPAHVWARYALIFADVIDSLGDAVFEQIADETTEVELKLEEMNDE